MMVLILTAFGLGVIAVCSTNGPLAELVLA